jgi:hypothetical protein
VLALDVALAGEPAAVPALSDQETLPAAPLSAGDIDEIIGQVEETSFDTAEDWHAELRARRLRLGDGDGLLVRGTRLLCGGTGNCQTWLFRRVEGKWRGLFADQAPIGEGIAFAGERHGGLPDVVIDAHVSASASERTVFAFDGRFYRAAKCFTVALEAAQQTATPVACR